MSDVRRSVDQYLQRCFSAEETPRVAELAAMLALTRERLSRHFTAATGLPLSAYLKRGQIRHAQQLLTTTDLSTTKIAYACGFGTRRTFYRAFRRAIGLTPDLYRRVTKCL